VVNDSNRLPDKHHAPSRYFDYRSTRCKNSGVPYSSARCTVGAHVGEERTAGIGLSWAALTCPRCRASRSVGPVWLPVGALPSVLGASAGRYGVGAPLTVRFYPGGTFIIEQGEPSGDLYLVLAGTVDIVEEDASGALNRVAVSGPGSFIGEDGIANGQPRKRSRRCEHQRHLLRAVAACGECLGWS
jgi:hypothetical protein